MTRTGRMLVGAVLALLAIAPPGVASFFKPAAGNTFFLAPGESVTINVSGTQGCTFVVMASSGDEEVATASASTEPQKKQQVVIEAVGPGSTTVQLLTSDPDGPCANRPATYEIVVEPDAKAFVKQYKAKLKEARSELKAALKDLLVQYGDELDALLDDLDAGTIDIEEAIAGSFGGTQLVVDLLDEIEDIFLDDVFADIWLRGLDSGFSVLDPQLVGLLPGGCGDWDLFEGQVEKSFDQFLGKLTKTQKSFAKVLDKAAQGDDEDLLLLLAFPEILIEVETPVPLPAPEPQEPPPAPPKPLKKEWTASGRLSGSPGSRLHVGGSTDPAGGDVTVTLVGPDGFSTGQDVPVDEACDWEADFTDLPPGSYTVTLTQGGNTTSFTTFVP